MSGSSRKSFFSGLLPHPPIVVPDVGGERLAECRSTFDACVEFAARFVAAAPERLFLISPHAPRVESAFGLYRGDVLRGDLREFGGSRASVSLPNDVETAQNLLESGADFGVSTEPVSTEPVSTESVSTVSLSVHSLDHGAVVPLWFLTQAGWDGPTCVAALPWQTTSESLRRFGVAVGEALRRAPGRAAIVASGDMTHRASPDAPAGYDPGAVEFDRQLSALVETGRLREIEVLDRGLRERAAEDAADTALIAAAANDFRVHGNEVLSYEHPFGVGYLVAVFHDGVDGASAWTD